jgi:hypothetical protein
VNECAEPGFDLKFAEGDAKALHDLFAIRGKKSGLYASVHPTLLLGKDVTRAGLKKALEAIAKEAHKEDIVVVSLSGHGIMLGKLYYFVPADFLRTAGNTLEDDVRKQAVPNDELCDHLRGIKALKKLVILDTCHSGGAVDDLLKTRRRNPFALGETVTEMNRNEGLFVLAASATEQGAREIDDLGHGLLTYTLLAAANAVEKGPLVDKGMKPTGPGGTIDVSMWFNHASGQVPNLMRKYTSRPQSPETGISGSSFPLLPARE